MANQIRFQGLAVKSRFKILWYAFLALFTGRISFTYDEKPKGSDEKVRVKTETSIGSKTTRPMTAEEAKAMDEMFEEVGKEFDKMGRSFDRMGRSMDTAFKKVFKSDK